ncbi:Na+/H+ antiporter NhaD type [Marinobacterium lacunae]|uniref:Na+/H+ antiporter NhaD type n=1 Tax=Marinobacterium lacunae TaxID=1232683 RepID=A0A081G4N3_9GAMM|nr:sodium:proton antiporter NhaD [Marinobacterium lacunae]KEA65738.1 Na+/H+ antiporter NhaD type [Marinobacterium lacunae]MBR9884771.1 sodium:proton antiporter [Oceanospirillales bacterium]
MHTLLILIAGLAFLSIVLEDVIHVNKAKTTLFFGTLSWMLIFLFPEAGQTQESILEKLDENLLEIASLWLFLMAAMTFVAFLNHQGLIETLIYKVLPRKVSERKLMFMVAGFAFAFSSLSDNITATLVSIALVLSLRMEAKKTLRFAVMVVFAVNSGGVALITGDVTTLMIFMANKVAIEDLLFLSLPALISVMVLATLLARPLQGEVEIIPTERRDDRVGKVIALIFLSTIIGTIILNVIAGIPPVLTFLFGLSIMFLIGRVGYKDDERESLLDYIRVIEYDTLLFFLGILLLVGMLKEIGVLHSLVGIYDMLPTTGANFVMGLLSSLVDNVPLTAALLKADIAMTHGQWLSLTYSVGVGGSLLVIGSAAGIVAMSKVEAVTFGSFARYSFYLLIAYSIGFTGSLVIGSILH